ncbi:MAG: peptidylprolyl isomerase [Planctomycetes bacterium]|nr:peptidylprolyl isomerase [Planctomycetota bacterium]
MKNTILCLILVMAIFSVSLATGASNPIVLMQTNYGDIELELFINEAPITVANFLEYVDSGFYNGLIFHRVMNEFMIQGGGFDQDKNQMETNDPIVNESSNGISNVRGTIAMARKGESDSATAQFFINQVDNDFLDKVNDGIGYCVFGQVVSGLETVDTIAVVETANDVSFPLETNPRDDVPVEHVIILNVERYATLVAPDGNDSNSVTPFETIQAAVDSTVDGGTIVLEPGIYTGAGNCDIVFGGKTITITGKNSSQIDPIAATIIDCNGSAGDEHQGFILDENDNVTIKNLTITGGYSRFGSAVYIDHATATIENCVIRGNVGTFDGGGICLVSSDGYITNCTIVDNSTTYNRYGIIYCVNSAVTVSNCILDNDGYSPKEIYVYKSTADVSYCNISGGYAGTGNIDVDPLFADVNNGNYHLASQGWQWDTTTDSWGFNNKTSYCIDAGDPNLGFSDEPDIAVIDPNNTRASRNLRINMGAYANKATASVAPFADFNNDNLVNFTDYATMMNSFMQTELTVLDINRDGDVDYNDLSMLAEDWLKGQGSLP